MSNQNGNPGLGTRSSKTFLQIKEGKIYLACAPGTEGSIVRKEKSYLVYDNITGIITGFSTRKSEYEGKPILDQCIDIVNGGVTYQLQMNVRGGYFRSLACKMPNVDLSKEVVLEPKMTEGMYNNKLTKSYSVFITQDGTQIKQFFTKENPNGLPEVEKLTKKNGEVIYDDDDRNAFLVDLLNIQMQSKLTPNAEAMLMSQPSELEKEIVAEDNAPSDESVDDGDLPF